MKNYSNKILILPDDEESLKGLKINRKKIIQIYHEDSPKLLIALDARLHWEIIYYFCDMYGYPTERDFPSPHNKDMVMPPTTDQYKAVGMGQIIHDPFADVKYALLGDSIHYKLGIDKEHIEQYNKLPCKIKFE